MKLSHFLFELPEERLAEYPAESRDESKLMVLNRKEQTIEHKSFKDIIDYFDEDDVMVLNNTKVFPARLYGNKEKTGARIEVFLLRELENDLWEVMVRPARKVRIGNKLMFTKNVYCDVIDNTISGGRVVRFEYENEDIYEVIDKVGISPLPPYIKRESEPKDKVRYQTVFAQEIKGITYWIDEECNVYDNQDIFQNKDNPRIIAKYTKQEKKDGSNIYNIPSLFKS